MGTRFGLILGMGCLAFMARQARAAEPEANAREIRGARPISLGLSLAWPWVASHDVTVPLPALRLGVNVSPRLAVELTGGIAPYGSGGRWAMIDLGARWFVGDGHASPYAMARAGAYFDRADEGDDRNYPYAVLGGGLEYACGCGFTAWGEVGPALVAYSDGVARSARPRGVATSLRRRCCRRSLSAMVTDRPLPGPALVHCARSAQRAQASALNSTSAPRSMRSTSPATWQISLRNICTYMSV